MSCENCGKRREDSGRFEDADVCEPCAAEILDTPKPDRCAIRAALLAEVVCRTCEGTGIMGDSCPQCDAMGFQNSACGLCDGKGSWEAVCAECDGKKQSFRTEGASEAIQAPCPMEAELEDLREKLAEAQAAIDYEGAKAVSAHAQLVIEEKIEQISRLRGLLRDVTAEPVEHWCNIDLLYGVPCTCAYENRKRLRERIAAELGKK